jgi:hypothetical protein
LATSTFNVNGKIHKVAGNFNNAGTYNPGGGTLELNGALAQTYFNAGVINNLVMNHPGPGSQPPYKYEYRQHRPCYAY